MTTSVVGAGVYIVNLIGGMVIATDCLPSAPEISSNTPVHSTFFSEYFLNKVYGAIMPKAPPPMLGTNSPMYSSHVTLSSSGC